MQDSSAADYLPISWLMLSSKLSDGDTLSSELSVGGKL